MLNYQAPAQKLNRRTVIAMYTRERQPDGTWRISGVVLLRTEETVS